MKKILSIAIVFLLFSGILGSKTGNETFAQNNTKYGIAQGCYVQPGQFGVEIICFNDGNNTCINTICNWTMEQ